MTYETVWSGTLERQQLCPSISGYIGGSTTGASAWSGRTPTPKRKKRVRPKTVKPRETEGPKYEAIANRLKRGYSYRATAKLFGMPLFTLLSTLKRGKRRSDYDRRWHQRQKASALEIKVAIGVAEMATRLILVVATNVPLPS